jgi:hypothetical protein
MAAAKGTTLPSFCILDSLQGVLPDRAKIVKAMTPNTSRHYR